ncbi:MAG: hypothetical protein V1765_03100 [bacterium]
MITSFNVVKSSDPSSVELTNFFNHYHQQLKMITGIKVITQSDCLVNHNKPLGVTTLRVVIDSSATSQKYVIGIKFSNFGEVTSIDLVALSLPHHKDVITKYFGDLGLLPKEAHFEQNQATSTPLSPTNQLEQWQYKNSLIIAGGWVNNDNGHLTFNDSSDDFTASIFGLDANELARAIYGIAINDEPEFIQEIPITTPGLEQLNRWLQVIDEYQGQNEFYPRFFDSCDHSRFFVHQLTALFNMKILDLITYRQANPIMAILDELADPTGLSQYIMSQTIIKKVTEAKTAT